MSSYPSDWDQRRKAVYQRDGYQCQNCGSAGGPKGNTELHAHHIVPKAQGGTHQKSNLITVCKNCHNSIHGNKPAPTANGVLSSSSNKPLLDATKTLNQKSQQLSNFCAQEFNPALEDFSQQNNTENAERLVKLTHKYINYIFELKKASKNVDDAESEAHHNLSQEYINKTVELAHLEMNKVSAHIELIDSLYVASDDFSESIETCPECGSSVDDSDSFCSGCGADISDIGSSLVSDGEIDVVNIGAKMNKITEASEKATIAKTEHTALSEKIASNGNVGWDYCPNCGINMYIEEKGKTATCPVCEASWKKERKGMISTKVVWEMKSGRNEGETKTKSEWNELANERNSEELYYHEWDEETAIRVAQELR